MYRASGGCPGNCLMQLYASGVWPGFFGSSVGKDVFSPKRAKRSWEEGSLKATASECFSFVPVVGNYMQALVEKTQSDT
eukprot:10157265-Heterocapsa_arctica.AAC.1